MKFIWFWILMGCCLPLFCSSQTLTNIGDLQQPVSRPFDFIKRNFVPVHNSVLFTGYTDASGYQLWAYNNGEFATCTDKNAIGNYEIISEAEHGFYALEKYDNTKYWLWKQDGTPGVSRVVADIKSQTPNDVPSMVSLHDKIYFKNYEPATGYELWVASGEPGSAHLLKDCSPGTGSAAPADLTAGESLIYFRCGRQLWRSDGTEAGTYKIFQVNSPEYLQYQSLKTIGDSAFFSVLRSSGKVELWVTDGTEIGTAKVVDMLGSSGSLAPTNFILNNKYCYSYYKTSVSAYEWVTVDANTGITQILLDFSQPNTFFLIPGEQDQSCIMNGYLYFTYGNILEGTIELWRSNGNAGSTEKVKTFSNYSQVAPLAATQNEFYFLLLNATDPIVELWSTNGSSTGTHPITTFTGESPYLFTVPAAANKEAVVFANPFIGIDDPDLPIKSDGTALGTFSLPGAFTKHQVGSMPTNFTLGPDSAVYFRAQTLFNSINILKATGGGPVSLSNLDTIDGFYYGNYNIPFATQSRVLWFTDFTTLHVVDAANNKSIITLPEDFTGYPVLGPGKDVYFIVSFNQIWKSDGTLNGTSAVIPVDSGFNIYGLIAANDKLYYLKTNGISGNIYESDGTLSGTHIVQGINPGDGNIQLGMLGDVLFYSSNVGLSGTSKLAITNHPPVIFDGQYDNDFLGITEVDNQVMVLSAKDYLAVDSFYHHLWRVENDQPVLVQQFKKIPGNTETTYARRELLHPLAHQAVFGASMENDNGELWTSDGTPNGTYLLKDLNPGGSSNPINFVRYNAQYYLFTANDGAHVSWWATDGTESGTFKVIDLAPVSGYFVPPVGNPFLTQNRLYFSLNDGQTGDEPWLLVLDNALNVSTLAPVQQAEQVHIWPNPATDRVYIDWSGTPNTKAKLELFSINGSLLDQKTVQLSENEPVLYTFPANMTGGGTFSIRLSTLNGAFWTQKVIRQP